MSIPIRTAITATTLFVAATIGAAGAASAHPADGGPTDLTSQPADCIPLTARYFDVQLDESGIGNIRVADDGITNCDEAVVMRSIASSSAVIDNHEPIKDRIVLQVAELEAAGPKGIDFTIELDPCWAGFQVLRDGDSLVHEEMVGDGCEMTVAVDFTGPSANAEIHVVQQTGTIAPPHIWDVDEDQVTHLSGLPSGTWYVKVAEGFTPDSSISVGPSTTYTDTVYGVGPSATVDIDIATEFGFSPTPTLTPPERPELRIALARSSGSAG